MQNSTTIMHHKGSIEKLKFRCIVVPDINIHRWFCICCHKGYLKAAKWLFGLGRKGGIGMYDDSLFNGACENGHLNVAKWLYSLWGTVIHINPAFRVSCSGGHLNVAKWLYRCANAHNPNGNGKLRGIDIHESGCGDDSDEECISREWAFRHSCKNGHLKVAKWLYSLGVDINAGSGYAFRYSCVNGHLHVAKWLISIGANIHECNIHGIGAFVACCKYNNLDSAKWLFGRDPVGSWEDINYAFQVSCKKGNLRVAEWLYYGAPRYLHKRALPNCKLNVDIHEDDEYAFTSSCVNGHLEVAVWLFSLGDVNIRADDNRAFRYSCGNGHVDVARWLYSIDPTIINDEHLYNHRSFINKHLL